MTRLMYDVLHVYNDIYFTPYSKLKGLGQYGHHVNHKHVFIYTTVTITLSLNTFYFI